MLKDKQKQVTQKHKALQQSYESMNVGVSEQTPMSPSGVMTVQGNEPKFRKIFEDLLIADQDQLALENEQKAHTAIKSEKEAIIGEKRPETPWM